MAVLRLVDSGYLRVAVSGGAMHVDGLAVTQGDVVSIARTHQLNEHGEAFEEDKQRHDNVMAQ